MQRVRQKHLNVEWCKSSQTDTMDYAYDIHDSKRVVYKVWGRRRFTAQSGVVIYCIEKLGLIDTTALLNVNQRYGRIPRLQKKKKKKRLVYHYNGLCRRDSGPDVITLIRQTTFQPFSEHHRILYRYTRTLRVGIVLKTTQQMKEQARLENGKTDRCILKRNRV